MPDKIKISFPHIGDYHRPISCFLKEIFPNCQVFPAPPITQKTVDIGSRYSPDFVCSPFKYNIGNYIEALELGANVLFQTGMGCRYGYYGEVQEQILRDLGYNFKFICLSRERARFSTAYNICKEINPKLSISVFVNSLLIVAERIRIMDKMDYFLRERIGFQVEEGAFQKAKANMFEELEEGKSLLELQHTARKYWKIYNEIEVSLPDNLLHVGIVGELYTLMEPFSNHYLEKQLADAGIMVSRKMSVTFLLFGKHDHISLFKSKGYLKNTVGANGIDSVSQCREYAINGYDGVLHIKSFGCTPELNAQPALINISRDLDMPILHLSFDAQTSDTGVRTRVEAFTDMIKMKRNQGYEKSGYGSGRRFHFHKRGFN